MRVAAALVIPVVALFLLIRSAQSGEPKQSPGSAHDAGIHLGVDDFTVNGAQVFFLPGGKDLVVGGGGGSDTMLRSAKNGQVLLKAGADGFGIAVSGDGKRIATAGRQITVFDRTYSKEILSLAGNNDGVMPVAFSPKGDMFAVADNSKRELSIQKIGVPGKVIMKNIGPRYSSLVFSKDGKKLFAGTHEYGIDPAPIDVFDASTGNKLKSLDAHHRAIIGLALSSSGNILTSAGEDGLGIWNLGTGKSRFLPSSIKNGPQNRVWSVAISPDGATIAAGTDESIRLIDTESGNLRKELRPSGHIVWGVGFSPDGSELASISGTDRRTLEIWYPATGNRKGADRHAQAVARIPYVDATRLISVGDEGQLKVWDLQKQKVVSEFKGGNFVVSPSGNAAYSTPAHLFDLRKSAPAAAAVNLPGVHEQAEDAAWTSAGSLIVADFFQQKIWLFDAQGKPLSNLRLTDPLNGLDFVRDVAAVPNRPEIYFGGGGSRSFDGSQKDSGFVGIWIPPAPTWKFLTKKLQLPVQELITTNSGKVLAFAFSYNDNALYDGESGKEISRVPNSRYALLSRTVSPDAKLIAFGGEKKTVLLWDVAAKQFRKLTGTAVDGKPERVPAPSNPAECGVRTPITGLVSALAFSPDALTLATGDPDGGVNVWSVKSSSLLRKLGAGSGEKVSTLSFSSDGKLLAGGMNDGSIRVWNLGAGK